MMFMMALVGVVCGLWGSTSDQLQPTSSVGSDIQKCFKAVFSGALWPEGGGEQEGREESRACCWPAKPRFWGPTAYSREDPTSDLQPPKPNPEIPSLGFDVRS